MMKNAGRKLLVVDDDPGIQRSLRWAFEDYDLLQATDARQAVKLFKEHAPDIVTLDLGLPPATDDATEGLAALREMLDHRPEAKIIVVSGNEDRANAVKAVAEGAYDFYAKPIDAQILSLIVERAARLFDLEEENRRLLAQRAGERDFGLITADAEMRRVQRMVEKVAPSQASVLLLGESGVGKELFARALHDLSDRAGGEFVAINCAAIPENLLESELFGHERGAFTGAVKTTKGKLEIADGGTVFLDEIGDMPPPLQAKLLRVLQERVIERVGGRESIPIDVRVVCATHRDLALRIEDEVFREDLYFRIGEITIDIPPLRERGDDVVLLARHFLEKCAAREKTRAKRLSSDAEQALKSHPWRGNVRELENAINRAALLSEGDEIKPADLALRTGAKRAPDQGAPAAGVITIREARAKAERDALRAAFEEHADNLTAAAKLLGVSRPTLYNLMKQHDIHP